MPPTKTQQQVLIVGPNRLGNELLAFFLAEHEGLPCQIFGGVEELAPTPPAIPTLLLLDWAAQEIKKLFLAKKKQGMLPCAVHLTALFNVGCGNGTAELALSRGAKGVFFQNDSLALFRKGVRALFSGEVWVPREVLTHCYLHHAAPIIPPSSPASILTRREVEILTLLAGGDGNQQIADRLCISISTVKTHTYNIYKKINVPNRLQAAFWAANNL